MAWQSLTPSGDVLSTQLPALPRAALLRLQPNSIEFDLAIDWRQLLAVLGHAKQTLCREQAEALAHQMAAYLKVGG
jgi:hypothetical protein